jgi:hypothetical protein
MGIRVLLCCACLSDASSNSVDILILEANMMEMEIIYSSL